MGQKNTRNYTPLPSAMIPIKKITLDDIKKIKGRPLKALIPQIKKIRKDIKMTRKVENAEIARKNRLLRMQKHKLIIRQKADLFLEEFIKNGGNATEAVLTISPHLSRVSAYATASKYLKELRGLGRLYLEKKGHSYGKLLDIAMQKVKGSKTPEWWDRIMKIADYEDFMTKEKKGGPQVVNIIQSHKDLTSSYIEGEVEDILPVEDNAKAD